MPITVLAQRTLEAPARAVDHPDHAEAATRAPRLQVEAFCRWRMLFSMIWGIFQGAVGSALLADMTRDPIAAEAGSGSAWSGP